MQRSFAITDIHGCAKTFKALVENVIGLTKEDKLFLLGDYIDRGPDSKGVIDYIISLKDRGYNVTALMGNHELMLLNSLEEPSNQDIFLINGGDKMLRSFGIHSSIELDPFYIKFFRSLEYFSFHNHFILVHAGINFNSPKPFEDFESMVWIRRFTVPENYQDRIIVHGHTPTSLMDIQQSFYQLKETCRINIDNGCVFGSANEFYGHLCALQLDNMQLFLQRNIENP